MSPVTMSKKVCNVARVGKSIFSAAAVNIDKTPDKTVNALKSILPNFQTNIHDDLDKLTVSVDFLPKLPNEMTKTIFHQNLKMNQADKQIE